MAEKKETKVSELVYIQSRLKAPKNQRNNFGGYNYRSCEDIMEAVKPLLKEVNCALTVSDDIVQISDRIYVKATATLHTPSGEQFTNSAFAREPLSKKGQDESQVTGAASSYARKYALNGLFCIDDTKDADALNISKDYAAPARPAPQVAQASQGALEEAFRQIQAATDTNQLLAIWNAYPQLQKDAKFSGAVTARKDQIQKNGKS